MAKWIEHKQSDGMYDSSGDEKLVVAGCACQPKKWLLCCLALLLGDVPAAPQPVE